VGLYVFRLGRSVIKNERFPPPNQKVIRDTKLIEGEKARARGRILVALSLLLISFGLFGAFYVPRVLDELIKPRDTLAESSSLIPFANTDGHS
jgi:hypothetical protein